jgi:tetratricopeptide (TPR) repeat protein
VDVLPASAVVSVPAGATAQETASRLGIRFVLQAAIQASGSEARLSVELFDAHTQSTCLSKKFAFDVKRPFDHVQEIANDTARGLKRPLRPPGPEARPRYSRDPLAYAEFMQGYQRSSSGDPKLLIEAIQHLTHAVTRDPGFALAHATLSWVSATRHFEFDPSRAWMDKAEFHCQRALELDPGLPEAHVSNAFLLWGPAKNFQHLEAIAELKRALALQKNLPHAYNRLGTILAHIGLLDHARTMYERGRPFQPQKKVSPSIAQVYMWSGEYERAREEVARWRAENPQNKYAIYFAPQPAMMCGDWEQAAELLDEAVSHMPQEPLLISLEGVLNALLGKYAQALQCVSRACENPKTFGHAHHTYYQIACINSLLGYSDLGFQWLERSVDTGFACWPFFMRDPCLKNLRSDARFELLVSSLQAKYPDHLGLL